jgi:tape measure domain-containing protein
MSTIDTLETRYEANILQFEREVARMAKISRKQSDAIAADQARAAKASQDAWQKANIGGALEKSFGSSIKNIGAELRTLAPLIAGAFGVREIQGAMDQYTRFSNSLKVTGLAGTALAQVQDALFTSAQKNGIALEPLSQLYGKASTSAKELGASQADLLKFTDGVTNALRVNGGTTESASGALTQLSQALGGGTIRAEEFNSILEGAKPILEAVVAGNTKFGGSVASLRTYMLAGKLTSKEFFDAFLAGSSMLEGKAANAPLTVAASLQTLSNSFVRYIGETDASLGATARISEAIKLFADNIDKLGPALLVISAAYAAHLTPAIIAGATAMAGKTAATIASTVADAQAVAAARALSVAIGMQGPLAAEAALAMGGLTVATNVAGTAMSRVAGLLGGPVGIAVIAITATIGGLTAEAYASGAAMSDLAEEFENSNKAIQLADSYAGDASKSITSIGTEADTSAPKIKAFAGEVGAAAQKLWELARAKKAAALADLDTQREKESVALSGNIMRQKGVRRKDLFTTYDSPLDAIKSAGRFVVGEGSSILTNGQSDRDRDDAVAKGRQKLADIDAARRRLQALPEKDFVDEVRSSGGSAAPTKKPKTNKGPSAADIARTEDTAIARAAADELNARLQNAVTEDERHKVMLEILDHDHKARLASIASDKRIGPTAKAELVKLENATNAAALTAESNEHLKRIAEVERDQLRAKQEVQRIDEDIMQLQARGARTAKERADWEAQILKSRQTRENEQIAADIKVLEASGKLAEALALKAQLPAIAQRQGLETADQQTQARRDQGDWAQWGADKKDELFDSASINKSLQEIADGGLSDLTDGITNAIMGAQSLGDVFKGVAKSIIADLIKIAIKMLIFKALGALIPGFGAVQSIAGVASAAHGSVNKHATGTNFAPGGLSLVGEKGPELVGMPRGAQVVPNNLLKNAFQPPKNSKRGGGDTFIFGGTTINADNAVMRADIDRMVYEANLKTFNAVRQTVPKDSARMRGNTLT